MPSAASSIARFALAARSAAATTTRFARLAERAALSTKAVAVECQAPSLGSHRAASGDLHLHRSPVALPPPTTGAPASLTLSYLKEPKPEGRVKFVVEEKDLESEEALWSLYERWCKAFNQERDHDEMVRWFNTFKKTVKFVHRRNSADLPNKLEINKFTDGKLRIPCSSPDPLLTRIEKEFGDNPVEFIPTDDGKLYRRVFADYKVVDGKLYVDVPKGGDLKTITTKPEYVLGGSAGNHHNQP